MCITYYISHLRRKLLDNKVVEEESTEKPNTNLLCVFNSKSSYAC